MFPQIEFRAIVGEQPLLQLIPPPYWAVVFPEMMLFVMNGEESCLQSIPPPLTYETLSTIEFPVMIGEALLQQNIPLAKLSEMTLRVMVGEVLQQQIPEAMPFVIVNPSTTEVVVSPLWKVMTVPVLFPSMMVTAEPISLLTVMAFPRKSMFST